ncbi:LysR family transcriptional regulator [Streptomyces sp. NBC_00878]|uniref:LysR family transcriptional regulator n=1 Tax=Streptomyces sp. NBC_00878 TaxID=2975854 RepID=UPI00225AA243|nr:LysR family transcriptional regulator [Streptomyces sp. NBC_00878]MCX4905179.1 LysR family transcriptional regulator [Streptomyces sp. NBC_00878]
MNLETVRAFVAVAEEGQFRHAAVRLGVSQQAVSKRVAALESSLGVTLFRRIATGAILTSDGRKFLPHARAVLSAVGQAVESVRRETRPLCVDVLGDRLATSAVLLEFHRAHQDIPLKTVMLNGVDAAVRALAAGEIDAAFVYEREPVQDLVPGLDGAVACLEALEIIVGEHHPLAGAESVSPAELAPFTAWVPGIVEGSEWGDWYREFAAEFSLTIDSTGPNFGMESLLESVGSSRSIFTFFGERVRIDLPRQHGLRRIPVVAPTPVYPWSLIWHSANEHPGLAALLAHVRDSPTPSDTRGLWLPRPFANMGA